MLKAKDIMTKNVISTRRETPIFEAVSLFAKNNITGLPVVEDDKTLVGIFTEKDALQLASLPKCSYNKTVDDFMTQPAVNFDENEGLLEICDCLINNSFRRVPVTSKGKLVGIISRRDIICEFILRGNQENIPADRDTAPSTSAIHTSL